MCDERLAFLQLGGETLALRVDDVGIGAGQESLVAQLRLSAGNLFFEVFESLGGSLALGLIIADIVDEYAQPVDVHAGGVLRRHMAQLPHPEPHGIVVGRHGSVDGEHGLPAAEGGHQGAGIGLRETQREGRGRADRCSDLY